MMPGAWTESTIRPSDPKPEPHWIFEVMRTSGHHPITLQLPLGSARALLSGFDQPDKSTSEPLTGLAPHFSIGPGALEALREFVQRGVANAETQVTVLAKSEDSEKIQAAVSGADGRIVGIGPAVNEALSMPLGPGMSEGAPPDPGGPEEDVVSSFDIHGDIVIMAVIDDGIGIANERFQLHGNKTRAWYFWDMNTPPPVVAPPRRRPSFGRDHTKAELDALLQSFAQDEDRFYRSDAMGMIDTKRIARQPIMYRRSHGTHVLDIAAGYDIAQPEQYAEARCRPIIAVQLPSFAIAERSDVFMAPLLRKALIEIHYQARLLSRAIAKARGENPDRARLLPLVLNFSFGTTAGPHDGTGPMEEVIREFLGTYRSEAGKVECEAVIPIGNSYLWRGAAKPKVDETKSIEIPWRVQPDDKTASYMHIWLPATNTPRQRIRVAAIPPTNCQPKQTFSEVGKRLSWVVENQILAAIYHVFDDNDDRALREHVVIALRPTEVELLGEPVSPHGLWTIRIETPGLEPGEELDVRVRRDDSLFGQRPTGRQSYLDHPDYVIYEDSNGRLRVSPTQENSPVTRQGTFNAYGTTLEPLVVGGYRWSDGPSAVYSGAGPTIKRNGLQQLPDGPDLSAVSEVSPAFRGVLASGPLTGQFHSQSGTSVAAPAIARELARQIKPGMPVGTARAALLREAGNREATGPTGPHGAYDPIGTDDQGRQSYIARARVGSGRLPPGDATLGGPDHRRRLLC